jgi:hypothetical protein
MGLGGSAARGALNVFTRLGFLVFDFEADARGDDGLVDSALPVEGVALAVRALIH